MPSMKCQRMSGWRCKTAAGGPVATKGEEYRKSRVSRNAASRIETESAFPPTRSEFPIEDVWSIWKVRLRAVARGLSKRLHGPAVADGSVVCQIRRELCFTDNPQWLEIVPTSSLLYIYCGPPCPFSCLAPLPACSYVTSETGPTPSRADSILIVE